MANVSKLIQLRDAIQEYHENFVYSGIFGNKKGENSNDPMNSLLQHNCNTAGCVVGFWGALTNRKTDDTMIVGDAIDDLALTYIESRFLFYGGALGPFPSFDYTVEGDYETAIDRIEYLIAAYSGDSTNDNN